jgi:hypothetical protein
MQMKMPDKPGAAQPVAATVTLDTFLHNFSVPRLMDKIADLEQHNLRAKIAAMSRPQNQQSAQPQKPHAARAFVQDLQLVDKLLVSFQRQVHGLPSLQALVGGMQALAPSAGRQPERGQMQQRASSTLPLRGTIFATWLKHDYNLCNPLLTPS